MINAMINPFDSSDRDKYHQTHQHHHVNWQIWNLEPSSYNYNEEENKCHGLIG